VGSSDNHAAALLTLLQNAEDETTVISIISENADLSPLALGRINEALGVIRSALAIKRAEIGVEPGGRRVAA
jgi:hypothetical protein